MPDKNNQSPIFRWRRTRKLLFNPLFIAIIPSVIIILLLPDVFSKFRIDEIKRTYRQDHALEYYVDLDNDGPLERIIAHKPGVRDCLTFTVFGNDDLVIDEYHFYSRYYESNERLYFHDIDNNGYKEVFGFSYNHDSIFLNWIEPIDSMPKQNPYCDSVFITTIQVQENTPVIDWYCLRMLFHDQNGDGYDEWIFAINAGRSEQPRKIFMYDYKNGKLTSSESFYSNNLALELIDFESDGACEILVSTNATSNSDSTNIVLSDWYPWFKIYDGSLDGFYQDPIQYPQGVSNTLFSHCDTFAQSTEVYSLFSSNDPTGNPSKIQFRDKNLEVKREYVFPEGLKKPSHNFFITRDQLVFQFYSDTLMLTSKDFKEIEIKQLPFHGRIINIGDLDENGEFEFMQISRNRKYAIIYTDNFTAYNTLYDEDLFGYTNEASIKLSKNRFTLQTGLASLILSYEFNIFYYLRFPFYLSVYLIISFLVWGIKKIQEIQSREKSELQSRVKHLQLTTIKNQLDPHLTFNALTVVSGLSKEGEISKLDAFISKFSKLLRRQLETSELITITLAEEIEFVENFIDIQKIRYEKGINLIKHIEDDMLMSFAVPKMLIHTHVENAIKHGILPKDDNGVINLVIKKHDVGIIISIQDNGVGRKVARKNGSQGSQTGLKVLDHIFKLYYQLYRVNIRQEIIDLYNDAGESSGTLINIEVSRPIK